MYLDRAINLSPKNVIPLEIKGKLFAKAGRNQEARGYFDRALELDPLQSSVLSYKAVHVHKENKLCFCNDR